MATEQEVWHGALQGGVGEQATGAVKGEILVTAGRGTRKSSREGGGEYFNIHFDFERIIRYVFHYFKHRGAADTPIHGR